MGEAGMGALCESLTTPVQSCRVHRSRLESDGQVADDNIPYERSMEERKVVNREPGNLSSYHVSCLTTERFLPNN
ncbi:MAG: hypothetical protein DDT24_00644 [Chloroflexi bacterium]|nr:hypothetical protein [Chloroflexota bacterium]